MKIPTQILLLSVLTLLLVNQSCRKPIREEQPGGLRLNASTSSCEGPQRYRNIILDDEDITVQNNIDYRLPNQYHNDDTYKDTLRLDLYKPNDNLPNRPLIIYMHGGGGFAGSKNNEVANCMNFAKRGYVVVAINYRLIKERMPDTLFSPYAHPDSITLGRKIITTGYYRAIQDARFAVRFVKHNAASVNVDTNKIFFSGLSNGGVQTLHVAYFDDAEAQAIDADPEDILDVDLLGPLDFTNGNVPFTATGKITAGICYSGWIFNDDWIEAGDPPMILVHAESDNYAPIDEGMEYVHGIFYLYGPEAVERKCMDVGVKAAYYPYLDGPPSCLYYQCGGVSPGDHGDVVTDPGGDGPVLKPDNVQLAFNALFEEYFSADCD